MFTVRRILAGLAAAALTVAAAAADTYLFPSKDIVLEEAVVDVSLEAGTQPEARIGKA